MLKQLFLATILFAGFCMSAVPDQIMMGTDGKNTITLTYVKISPDIEDEALRIRYRVEKESPLAKNRASASICCTNQVLTPEEVAQAAADKAAADQAAAAAAAANAGGRNLADEPAAEPETPVYDPKTNVGKCFGLAFYCGLDSCTAATQLDLVFFQSTISGGKWQAATSDYSSKNVGSVNIGSGTDFTTRYSFNKNEAEQSSIPAFGTGYQTQLDCYTAYDTARENVQLNTEIDLQDATKWAKNENVVIKVAEGDLAEEEEVSGAFTQLLPLGFLGMLVAFFTIL